MKWEANKFEEKLSKNKKGDYHDKKFQYKKQYKYEKKISNLQ